MAAKRKSSLLKFARSPASRGAALLQQALLVFLGVLCGLLLFNNVLMPRVVRHGNDVRIPAVAGKELAEAERILRKSGLEPVRGPGRHHREVPPGHVLEISPPIGLSVKRGRQVFITPSIGAIDRRVPDVTGVSVRMARIKLSEAGLRVRKTNYAATDLVEPDLILAMSPEPGEPVPLRDEVTLLVSQRRSAVPCWLPDLRGRAGRQSAAWLESNGLRAEIQEGPSTGIPGTVVMQDPVPGSPVWPGARISLAVAPGEAPSSGYGGSRPW